MKKARHIIEKKGVRTHKFNKVKYRIDLDSYDGWCDDPRTEGVSGEYPAIRLPEGLPNTKKALINLLHECLHAEKYSTSEKVIERVSNEIGSLLWRLEYRRGKK